MKKAVVAVILTLAGISTSCRTLSSTTYISPDDSFLLGNNEHGKFNVKLKNVSSNSVEIYRAPIGGGRHSRQTIQPSQTVKVRVESNTALVIDNKSTDTAAVKLLVVGDTGLSMSYRK